MSFVGRQMERLTIHVIKATIGVLLDTHAPFALS